MIQLDGLTKHQIALLDKIWSIDSVEDCQAYIMALPEADQFECQNLVRLIALELIDQAVDKMDDWTESREVLDQFKLT
jgi:adenylosuccinate synthase